MSMSDAWDFPELLINARHNHFHNIALCLVESVFVPLSLRQPILHNQNVLISSFNMSDEESVGQTWPQFRLKTAVFQQVTQAVLLKKHRA